MDDDIERLMPLLERYEVRFGDGFPIIIVRFAALDNDEIEKIVKEALKTGIPWEPDIPDDAVV